MKSEDYLKLHTKPLIPTNIKIEVEPFKQLMEEYKHAFKRWGVDHYEYNRYGLPLINLNGDLYNNPEPTCYALDRWNTYYTDNQYRDHDFRVPTEVYEHEVFDDMKLYDDFIIRSCILKWKAGSKFMPHTDTIINSDMIRLWGTTNPKSVKLRFASGHQRCHPYEVSKIEYTLESFDMEIEAGRLYLFDSNIIHDATSYEDDTYQFFIAYDEALYPYINSMIGE